MAKSNGQKLKLLYVMELLWRNGHYESPVSMKQIIDELEAKGIKAERKSIYDDIEVLKYYGMDIKIRREQPAGYYVVNRFLSKEDCRTLADLVQATPYLTGRKSRELAARILEIGNDNQRMEHWRSIEVDKRIHFMSESMFQNLGLIYRSWEEGCCISFRYAHWTIDAAKGIRRQGESVKIIPTGLLWKEGRCLIKGYDVDHKRMSQWELERMTYIKCLKEPAFSIEEKEETKKEARMVRVYMENQHIEAVIEEYGEDISMETEGGQHFIAEVPVYDTDAFYVWMTKMGMGAKILAPQEMVEDYQSFLQELLKQY